MACAQAAPMNDLGNAWQSLTMPQLALVTQSFDGKPHLAQPLACFPMAQAWLMKRVSLEAIEYPLGHGRHHAARPVNPKGVCANIRLTQMLAIRWHTIDDRYLAPSDELDGTALGR
jgi:hypothetical protein